MRNNDNIGVRINPNIFYKNPKSNKKRFPLNAYFWYSTEDHPLLLNKFENYFQNSDISSEKKDTKNNIYFTPSMFGSNIATPELFFADVKILEITFQQLFNTYYLTDVSSRKPVTIEQLIIRANKIMGTTNPY